MNHKWELIDHINRDKGIVARKEDVIYYRDGIVTLKDNWPYKDGKRECSSRTDRIKQGMSVQA